MRTLRVTTLACLATTLACGGAGERGGSPRAHGSLLAYYETYDPRSLDPALSTDVPTGEMVALAYEGLTQFDPDGQLLPALADRWTVTRWRPSGLRYVFHLRAGVKFHDGTPLTPPAGRATYRACMCWEIRPSPSTCQSRSRSFPSSSRCRWPRSYRRPSPRRRTSVSIRSAPAPGASWPGSTTTTWCSPRTRTIGAGRRRPTR